MTNKRAIIWLRRDFRLQDNSAIYYALEWAKKHNGYVSFVFHLNPDFYENKTNQNEYFFKALLHFSNRLSNLGIDLYVVYGSYQTVFTRLFEWAPDINCIFYNKDELPNARKRDLWVNEFCSSKGCEVHEFDDYHLHGANEVTKHDGTMYKVFTPYFKSWSMLQKPRPRIINENELVFYSKDIPSAINDKHLLTNYPYRKEWVNIGEENALAQLHLFINNRIEAYGKNRNFPSVEGTSKLSSFLITGAIAVRTIYSELENLTQYNKESVQTFIQELAWRDFYHMIHVSNPLCQSVEINEQYRHIAWSTDEHVLKIWSTGQTGYPIVDAGMRQLNNEGWMHNRLRMITASFLTKDLLVDWRLGESYFNKVLIDYEAASNIGGWQWAASVGTDAVPYFRIFNPVTQSKKFDQDGKYIRKYIPELKDVPDKYIHEPWKMSVEIQKLSGCIIGQDYPAPIVDHAVQRLKAIQLFKSELLD
ncbi:deoxyribodipyrimidine photo-lyase [Bacillus sp. HMF5848]|uniref:cryptochrome/photolyase family protein n=1 Tax=Bacillus sp. HMF5848 TaxID=2495421 RepID=UPI000F77FA79|nr:deoxyribodipyrimidine photo-lyase [Bacillus sp. HMF5848]RSK26896.1 deoxyribodipyrimidine photo-lyase [Bacillus sp. HMF5848]